MKFLVTLIFVLTSVSLFGQSDAVQYLDVIGQQFQKISHEMMGYASAVNHGKSARKVEKRRQELLSQVKESEQTVRKLKPFNGVTTLRDSMAAYFKMTNQLLNQDYAKIVDMEEIAEQSYDAMEAYLLAKEKAEEKLDNAHEAATGQYEAFAAANNIKLVKSESALSTKLEKTNRVSQYTNKAYLLFFKSYKNEVYLMDALKREDITALEQSRNALSTSATEDLAKVGPLGNFNGDASLRTALQQVLNFYKTEANDKMKVYSDFLLAKDNYEKIKKSFDALPASKRTKENIDDYNRAIADFNVKVKSTNAMNDDLNKKRNTALENWNKAYETFLDKHTPKYK
jgi:hypothetical protein